MGKTIIKVLCIDQRLILTAKPRLASGGRNEDEVQFEFCSLWDGFSKTAVFFRSEEYVYRVALTNNKCLIPPEVLSDDGWLYFGVVGVKGEATRTSEVLRYRIVQGAITPDTDPPPPTPSVYQQIMNELAGLEARVDAVEKTGGGTVTPEAIAEAVDAYLEENPVTSEPGPPGPQGEPGADGVGIKSIKQAPPVNGVSTLTIAYTDGKTSTFQVQDGVPGGPGEKGDPGVAGTGIASITETPVGNGLHNIVIELTDGRSLGFSVQDGAPGVNGVGIHEIGESPLMRIGENGLEEYGKQIIVAMTDGSRHTFDLLHGAKGERGPAAEPGRTPVKGEDYWTDEDRAGISADIEAQVTQEIAAELAKRGQLRPEFANSIAECTDTSKLYVLPDGFIYGYVMRNTEPEPLYTNRLDSAEIRHGYRYSKSGAAFKELAGCDAVILEIPTSGSVIIRFRNCGREPSYPQVYGGKSNTNFTSSTYADNASKWLTDANGDSYVQFTNSNGDTHVVAMLATVDKSAAIITVNEEIKWSAGGTTYKWANTGHAFVPADYEDRIVDLETDAASQAQQIALLEKKVENVNADASLTAAYNRIKRWRYPIYEDAPVFLLETNKVALSGNFENTNAVYAKYDALMSAHSHYITRENCGMASDGATPIYVYHFAEPEPHKQSSGIYLETKPVILVCSGVHPREIAGVYAMYYAMEEITTNPKLLDLRRNVHFVIMPMINPTAFSDTTYYMRNPDGIQVHYNFEVDFGNNGAVQGDRNYGGASPLSIPETQYFDALMNEYKDTLACVLSCHNNEVDEKYGTGFIWCSCATDYMVNLGNRFIDKMSAAWLEKHGETLKDGIRWANDYALAQAAAGTNSFFVSGKVATQPDWDIRLGRSAVSGSGGTEYKQAIKYGVHGANVEVCPRCLVLDRDYSKKYTANVMTMGTETYINYFRTFMRAYDPKNKKDYAPNLPWEG